MRSHIPQFSASMLDKFAESTESNRTRNNTVVMSMMPPPPLYASSSTTPRRPNDSTGGSSATNSTVVNIVAGSPGDTTVVSTESTVKQLAPQYQCQVCSKCFSSVATLSVHLNSHENSTHMEYRNTGGTNYNGHIVTGGHAIIKTEPQSFQLLSPAVYGVGGVHGFQVAGSSGQSCQICQKVFNSNEQYQSHMKIHENEFRNRALYQASSSSSSSGQQQSTVVQQQISVKDLEPPSEEEERKPIDCIVCHKKFQTATQLAVHLREHSSEKPYR